MAYTCKLRASVMHIPFLILRCRAEKDESQKAEKTTRMSETTCIHRESTEYLGEEGSGFGKTDSVTG